VRTSAPAILIASFIPAAIYAIASIPRFATAFGAWQPADRSAQILQLAISCYLFAITVLITLMSIAFVVGITHALARSLQRMREMDYAAIGAIVSLVAAPMLYSYLPVTMPMPMLILAAAMTAATYRRFAGLEPGALLATMLAADPNGRAGEHHAARRRHALIANS